MPNGTAKVAAFFARLFGLSGGGISAIVRPQIADFYRLMLGVERRDSVLSPPFAAFDKAVPSQGARIGM